MNVTNNNIGNFDWSKTLDAAFAATEAKGAEGLSDKGPVGGAGLSITQADGGARPAGFASENPALDPATTRPDPDALGKIDLNLNGLVTEFEGVHKDLGNQVKAANITASSAGTQKILFDIYQLMSLMIKISQQLRETSRNARQSDLLVATASIQSQAEAQRSAAAWGLGLSLCLSGISIACSLGMAIKSATASGKAISMEKQIGCDQAQKAYSLSQSRTPADAKAELTKVEATMTGDQITEAQQNFETSGKARADLETAQANLDACVNARDELNAKAGQIDEQITAKKAELETANQSVKEKKTELLQAKSELKKAEQNGDFGALAERTKTVKTLEKELNGLKSDAAKLSDEVKTLEAQKPDIGKLDQKIANLKTEVGNLKNTYETQLTADMKSLEGKLDIAQAKLKQARLDKLPDNEIKTLEADVKKLETQATWGRAHVTNEYHANGMNESILRGMTECKQRFDDKKDALSFDGEYKKAKADADKYSAFSQIVTQLNGVCQSITQYTVSSKESEATAKQKEQKEAEAARESSNELFADAKELTESVLKLVSAMQQSESQTVHQIMA